MRLAAIPATVTDLVERLFVRCMMILLIAREPKGDGAASGSAKHTYCESQHVDVDQRWVRRRARFAQVPSHAPTSVLGQKQTFAMQKKNVRSTPKADIWCTYS